MEYRHKLRYAIINKVEYLTTLLIVLAVTVFFPFVVHELGHYGVARLFKVPIKVFSVGIGKPILKYKDRKGTLWQFGWIPVTGCIRTGDSLRQVLRNQNPHSRLKAHMCIAAAGPLLEIFIGVIMLYMVGISGEARLPARIGAIAPNSPVALSGLSVGDVVTEVNGNPIHDWNEFFEHINSTRSAIVTLATSSTQHVLNVPEKSGGPSDIGYNDLGSFPSYNHYNLTVYATPRNLPARKAGIEHGDAIIKINKLAVKKWADANYTLIHHAGSTITVAIRRQGADVILPVTLNPGNSQLAIAGDNSQI